MAERSFYGGATPTGGQGGEISAGRYSGPEARASHPWKCPACAAENAGRLELGCVSCGAGKPGYHVGLEPPPAAPVEQEEYHSSVNVPAGTSTVLEPAFQSWLKQRVEADGNPWGVGKHESLLREAFEAGWMQSALFQARRTMQAPPVTADVADLAPAGKPARTIIAALELFKDHVLRGEPDEVASGEWCSIGEVDQLIEGLKERAE